MEVKEWTDEEIKKLAEELNNMSAEEKKRYWEIMKNICHDSVLWVQGMLKR